MRAISLCCLAFLAEASPAPRDLFHDFVKTYSRQYESDAEMERRFQIFSDNIALIQDSNSKNRTYTLGVTSNADRTFEEWRSEHLTGFNPQLASSEDRDVFTVPESFTPPESVDWVKKGGVTSVKNQGSCGSCWAFSTAGALEGAMFVAGRPVVELSMQHIIACDSGGNGCGGGLMDQAFDWVSKNGVPSLKDEPYLCQNGESVQCKNMACGSCVKQTGETCIFGHCRNFNGSCVKTGLIHHCECPGDTCFSSADQACAAPPKPSPFILKPGDVTKHTDVQPTADALEAALAQQPVSVAIEADKFVFQHYTSGVLTDDACGSALDHGVLAVGYGVDNGQMYWKVKNSWGTSFGEDGYIRIAKGKATDGGECGIREKASFPTVKSAFEDIVV